MTKSDPHRPRGLASAACGLGLALASAATAAPVLDPGTAPRVSVGGQAPVIVQSGQTTDVTLGAPRTLITWSGFNVESGTGVTFRFGDGGWIVLNRVSQPGAAFIDGRIEALVGEQFGRGNVWFSAPGGIVFGPNARVDVGGLLATSARVSPAGFLDADSYAFDFEGVGPGEGDAAAQVAVRAGARLRGYGGTIALVADRVVTEPGAAITGIGGTTVLYGAASDFTIRLAPHNETDLELLDFVVPGGGGTHVAAPLLLEGQTVARTVFVAAVTRVEVVNAVINAPGLIAAQAASSEGSDVVLSAGLDIVDRRLTGVRSASPATLTATFGTVAASGDLTVALGPAASFRAGAVAAGGALEASVGGFDATSVNVGGPLTVVAPGAITFRGDSSAGGGIDLSSSGRLTVGAAGGGVLASVGDMRLGVGGVRAGRLVSGGSLVVRALGPGGTDGRAVDVGAALAADRIDIASGGLSGGIFLGAATLTGADGPGQLALSASGDQADVTFGAAGGGRIVGAGAVRISASRDATANVAGLLRLDAGSAGRTFAVAATDLEIAGPLVAQALRVESLQGPLTIGDATDATATGLRIGGAEFQFIQAREASFYAAPAASLTVHDLNVEPARVPRLNLFAGAGGDVVVRGVLAPTATGGALAIGEEPAGSAWRPGRILVSGSIGASRGSPEAGFTGVRAFDTVRLGAARDILIGSQRFIDLVAAAPPTGINVARGLPAGVQPTPEEVGRVFLAAGTASLSASERIVQQNTALAGLYNGLFLTNAAAAPTAATLTVEPGTVVDLFGALVGQDGQLRAGRFAALAQELQVQGAPGSDLVRFNGCPVGLAGACRTPVDSRLADVLDLLSDIEIASERATLEPLLAIAAAPEDEDEDDPIITGAGNEEIWRRRK